jgi:hypothetical protein
MQNKNQQNIEPIALKKIHSLQVPSFSAIFLEPQPVQGGWGAAWVVSAWLGARFGRRRKGQME